MAVFTNAVLSGVAFIRTSRASRRSLIAGNLSEENIKYSAASPQI
jgi:hypothetical protein